MPIPFAFQSLTPTKLHSSYCKNLHDFLSACLVRFLSLGAVLVGPLVAVFTRLSRISSSPSVKLPLGWPPKRERLVSLRCRRHGRVPCMLSTSDMSLPRSWRNSASALSSFVRNLPICRKVKKVIIVSTFGTKIFKLVALRHASSFSLKQ